MKYEYLEPTPYRDGYRVSKSTATAPIESQIAAAQKVADGVKKLRKHQRRKRNGRIHSHYRD